MVLCWIPVATCGLIAAAFRDDKHTSSSLSNLYNLRHTRILHIIHSFPRHLIYLEYFSSHSLGRSTLHCPTFSTLRSYSIIKQQVSHIITWLQFTPAFEDKRQNEQISGNVCTVIHNKQSIHSQANPHIYTYPITNKLEPLHVHIILSNIIPHCRQSVRNRWSFISSTPPRTHTHTG